MFSENIFWIASSPIISEPVIDRYKQDSEAVLRIGDLPDDELEFCQGETILDEIKGVDVGRMDADGYKKMTKRLNTILAEMGVTNSFDLDEYIFSDKDIEVFSEIFYLLEEMEHKFTKHPGDPLLYLKIANLFYFTGLKADVSFFEVSFREKVTEDLFDEADGYYNLAIENDDDHTISYINSGLLNLEKSEISKAADKFRAVLDRYPDNLSAKTGMIKTQIRMGKLEEAEAELNNLLGENDDKAELWYLKGEIARLKDRWGGAVQFYNQCLKIDYSFEDALLKKCEILLDRGMYSQANNSFDEYIKENKHDAHAWFGKARALYGMDKWGGAIQCVNEAIALNPQITDAWVTKGDVLSERNQYDIAIRSYENALKLDPNHELAKEKLEKTKEKLG